MNISKENDNMKKLILIMVFVCLGIMSYSGENGCGSTNTNKTKQTIPTKDTKKEKKGKKQIQKKEGKNTQDNTKTSGICKIK